MFAFRSPRDVVPVTKGIDIEDVGVRGCDEEVLRVRCDHVPWIQVQDCHGIVNAKDGSAGYPYCERSNRRIESGDVSVPIAGGGAIVQEEPNDEEQNVHDEVDLNEAEDHERYDVAEPFRPHFISKSEDELEDYKRYIDALKDCIENWCSGTEGKGPRVLARR